MHFPLKNLILKIILFFFLFSYLFPIEFTFLPFGTVRIVQGIGLIYFIFTLLVRKLPTSVLIFWGCAFLISCVGFYSTSIFNQANDFSVIQVRGIYVFLYTISAYLIVSIVRKITKTHPFYTLVEWMVVATVVYALISFVLFLSPDSYSIYKDLIVANDRLLTQNQELVQLRLLGLSHNVQYANAAVFYGIVMWAVILVYKNKETFLFHHKWIFYSVISLLVVAGIFSGRTFFIMLLFTVLYILLLNGKKGIWKTMKDCFVIFFPVILIASLGITYFMANNEDAMEWAFELFINMTDGEMRSDSTDTLKDMLQILPDKTYTWIVGDGLAEYDDGTFYMDTDAGYLRSIFYWGLFGTIIYYIVLYIYFKTLKKCSKLPNLDVYFFIILFFTYIYNIKDFYQPVSFLVLYLMALVEFPKRNISYKIKL